MPSRIVREGILDSDRVNSLDFPAEVFYRRLMSKVDDHGLYDARLEVLKSHLYPVNGARVRETDISRWMAACQKAGLIVLYSVAGKPYLQMLDTKWPARSEPKFPLQTVENNCSQPETDVPVVVVVDVVEDVVVGGTPRKRGKQPKVSMPEGFGISDRVRKWAAEKGYSRLDERLEHFIGKARANGYTYADWDEALMGAVRDDWAKLADKPDPSARRPTPSPAGPSETPLEKAVNWARQQCRMGVIDAAERDRQIAEATNRYRGAH